MIFYFSIGGSFTFKRQTDAQACSDEVVLIAFDGLGAWVFMSLETGQPVYSGFFFFFFFFFFCLACHILDWFCFGLIRNICIYAAYRHKFM